MKSIDALLKETAQAHGHLCPGQVIGVRMALEGCRRIGLDNPGERPWIKKLIVYVEM
ncbi:MAG: FmdE family protein, partial [Desulfotignum sp.]